MNRDDDAAAVDMVRNGDIEAFGEIVERHQGRLLAFARRYFPNQQDAEDFAQDVFLQAFRRIATYRGESRFLSWLLSIAYRHAVRTRDRQADYGLLDAEAVPGRAPDPAESLVVAEARREILQSLRELPVRFATCIDLYFFFGMDYESISETSGIPLNTVRSHIRRAKRRLRTTLAGCREEVSHDV
jgi:RNA polymerase sigma-70 factor (ECF subfamily)